MKSKEEIKHLAFLKYPRVINDPYNPIEDDNSYERKIWIDGYTQCQEDMDVTLQGKCLSGKSYNDCHIHSSNLFGCLSCGNFERKQD